MPQIFTSSFPFPYSFPTLVYAVINKYPSTLASHVISVDVLEREIMDDGTIRSERVLGVQQDSPKWVNRLLGAQDVTYVREVSFVVPSATPIPALLPHESSIPPTASPVLPAASSSSSSSLEPPKLIMASTNLTLGSIMQCRESITYIPHPWPVSSSSGSTSASLSKRSSSSASTSSAAASPSPSPSSSLRHPLSHPSLPSHTLFSQSALIFTAGHFAAEAYPPAATSGTTPIAAGSLLAAKTAPQRMAGRRIEAGGKGRFVDNAERGRGALNESAEKVIRAFWRGIDD